jgi:hypothetical protein
MVDAAGKVHLVSHLLQQEPDTTGDLSALFRAPPSGTAQKSVSVRDIFALPHAGKIYRFAGLERELEAAASSDPTKKPIDSGWRRQQSGLVLIVHDVAADTWAFHRAPGCNDLPMYRWSELEQFSAQAGKNLFIGMGAELVALDLDTFACRRLPDHDAIRAGQVAALADRVFAYGARAAHDKFSTILNSTAGAEAVSNPREGGDIAFDSCASGSCEGDALGSSCRKSPVPVSADSQLLESVSHGAIWRG